MIQEKATHHVAEVYRQLKDEYDENLAQVPFFINCYALFEKLLDRLLNGHRYDSVLDLGCGPGIQTVRLARHARRVIGVDISDDMLDLARARCREHPNVVFIKEDARALSFETGAFDAIFSYGDVLSHIVDGYEAALAEMGRVARPGALITFEVDNKWHPGIFYTPGELVRNLVSPGHGHAGRKWHNLSFRTFTYFELRKLLNRHGMEIVEFHGHNMLASLIPDRYVLERKPRTLGGRAAIWLGRIDLGLSDVFPFNRMGFNSIVVAKKR